MGNLAFMPLNLCVVILNGLASRSPVLDPAVKRALRLLAAGSAAVFIGNSISTWYLVGLQQNPPVTWADLFYLSDSVLLVCALLLLPAGAPEPGGALEIRHRRRDGGRGRRRAIWYFSVRPPRPRARATWS